LLNQSQVRAALESVADVGMTVSVLAGQGDKEAVGRHLSRIDVRLTDFQ